MSDIAALLQIAGSIALITVPAIALGRLLADHDGPSLSDVLATPLDPPWPRGVQEEEPVRWHVEALRPWRAGRRPADLAEARAAGRQAVGFGSETGQC